MDERKNKMTDQRYREILPMAYMTAAIEKGRQPRPVEVGLCARAIVDAEDENNLAYRVAMATKIHCTIVGVKRVSTKTGYDKYEITYRTFGKDEDETIPSPLIGDFRYGKVTEWLWAKKNDDGTDYWPGRRAVLYKHNDPPKEGTCRARVTAAASSPKPSTSNSDYHFLRHAASHYCPSQIPVRRHPENGATDFENHTIVGSRSGVLMPRRRAFIRSRASENT